MPVNTKALYDPVTKKCCPKRCMATANAMSAAIDGITLAVTRAINDAITNRQEQIDFILSIPQRSIDLQLDHCEKRLQDIYHIVQSQYVPKYADTIQQVEKILTTEYTYEQETGTIVQDRPSVGETTPQTYDQSYPSPKEQEQVSRVELPTKHKVISEDCIAIDLCDDLKRMLLRVANYIAVNLPNITAAIALAADKPIPDPSTDDKKPDYHVGVAVYYDPLKDAPEDVEEDT